MNSPENIQWTKLTSANGKEYEAGIIAKDAIRSSTTKHGVKVHWTVGEDKWIETSKEVRAETAITRYKLYKANLPVYKYIFEFTISELYNIYFVDESGDRYQIGIFQTGDHKMKYDSEQPTIIEVGRA